MEGRGRGRGGVEVAKGVKPKDKAEFNALITQL